MGRPRRLASERTDDEGRSKRLSPGLAFACVGERDAPAHRPSARDHGVSGPAPQRVCFLWDGGGHDGARALASAVPGPGPCSDSLEIIAGAVRARTR